MWISLSKLWYFSLLEIPNCLLFHCYKYVNSLEIFIRWWPRGQKLNSVGFAYYSFTLLIFIAEKRTIVFYFSVLIIFPPFHVCINIWINFFLVLGSRIWRSKDSRHPTPRRRWRRPTQQCKQTLGMTHRTSGQSLDFWNAFKWWVIVYFALSILCNM